MSLSDHNHHLELNDPYELVFNSIADPGPVDAAGGREANPPRITSEAQWHHFIDGLTEAGLISDASDADKDVIADIWAQLLKEGAYFQPKGKPRINLTYQAWQKMLCDRLAPDLSEMERHINNVNLQVCWVDTYTIHSATSPYIYYNKQLTVRLYIYICNIHNSLVIIKRVSRNIMPMISILRGPSNFSPLSMACWPRGIKYR